MSRKSLILIGVLVLVNVVLVLALVNVVMLAFDVSLLGYYILPLSESNSMEPAYDESCVAVIIEDPSEYDSFEDEVVSFSAPTDDRGIFHRVVAEYDDYNPETATHRLTEDGRFITDVENGELIIPSEQEKDDFDGEHILIAKGDNNEIPDPYILTEDDINGVAVSGCLLSIDF